MVPHISFHNGRRGIQAKRLSSGGNTNQAMAPTFTPMRITRSERDWPPLPGRRKRSANSAGSL